MSIIYITPERPANRNDWQSFYTKEIEVLLERRGKMALGDMAIALAVRKGTLISYLKIMRAAGIVRRDGYHDGKPMWMLGEEVTPPKNYGKPVGELHTRQATVPARQVGMSRHWMDVALFGPAGAPAQGAAA
jgi:hypothetical protein